MQGHHDHNGDTKITTSSDKNASWTLWFFVDVVTCCYKCKVTTVTTETQRSRREAKKKVVDVVVLRGRCDLRSKA